MRSLAIALLLCGHVAAAAPRRDVTTPPDEIAAPPAKALRDGALASQILVPGTGAAVAAGDRIALYLTEWSSDGTLIGTTFDQIPVARTGVITDWPDIAAVLAHMTVGEKRRIWRPAGVGYHVYDVELAAIREPHPAAGATMPPSVDAERSASGLSWLVLKAGDGAAHPDPLDQVSVVWGMGFVDQQVAPEPMPMTFYVRDARYPGLVEALRDMVVGERRLVWIPPALGGGHAVAQDLRLVAIEPHVPAPADLTAPPRDRHPVSPGIAYRTLAQGVGTRLVADDDITMTSVIWDARGVTLEHDRGIRWRLAELLPELRDGLIGASEGERRRIWIAKPSGRFAGQGPIVIDAEVTAIHRMFDALPGNLRIAMVDHRLVATRGATRAPLPWSPDAVVGAPGPRRSQRLISAKRDAAHGTVELTLEDECILSQSTTQYPEAAIEARVKNADALALHRARRFAKAASEFRDALAIDPGFALARMNLVAALAMAGEPSQAVAAASPLIAANPALVQWQVIRDPEWASIATLPEIAALRAAAPGTATLAMLRGGAAWSERHHLIAALQAEYGWGADPGMPPASERVEIRDARGTLLAILERDAPAIDRLLGDLGFVPGEPGVQVNAAGAERYRFAQAGFGLVVGNDQIRLVQANTVLAEGIREGNHPVWTTLLPHAVVTEWVRAGSEGCDSTDPTWISVLPF